MLPFPDVQLLGRILILTLPRGWKGRVLAKFIRANWMKIVLAQSVCRCAAVGCCVLSCTGVLYSQEMQILPVFLTQ